MIELNASTSLGHSLSLEPFVIALPVLDRGLLWREQTVRMRWRDIQERELHLELAAEQVLNKRFDRIDLRVPESLEDVAYQPQIVSRFPSLLIAHVADRRTQG